MRISDWSSDVCSSDLADQEVAVKPHLWWQRRAEGDEDREGGDREIDREHRLAAELLGSGNRQQRAEQATDVEHHGPGELPVFEHTQRGRLVDRKSVV